MECPLFETERVKNRGAFRIFAGSVLSAALLVWTFRSIHLPAAGESRRSERWAWAAAFCAELWFGLYWIITLSVRWNPIRRRAFRERLSQRYDEEELPGVDVFVCTADPRLEPPSMVASTVLSVMAYDYPPGKLAVYLSDDGGSEITFYAMWEASRFARHWIPFCRSFRVANRSPGSYFREPPPERRSSAADEEFHRRIEKMYAEMEERIESATKAGVVPEEIRMQHKGFSEWNSEMASNNHQAIVKILVESGDEDARDDEGLRLPMLVYVAREKRPHHPHHFKAGAMNALIRVSSVISAGPIILNVDCDMFSNDPNSIRDALCFFMDQEKGNEIAYVQFTPSSCNITTNDLYGNALKRLFMDFHGLDANGGPLYTGSGCFHRRHSLLGNKHIQGHDYLQELVVQPQVLALTQPTTNLEAKARSLSSCAYELNTHWGKLIGLRYGYPVEDVVTGISIQCNGWRSIFHHPPRPAFVGVAPVTLLQTLVQHKRWSEGDFQLFLSKYCPFVCGYRKMKLSLQMGYCIYFLWALNSFPTLFYMVVPSLLLLTGTPLFPSVTSIWSLPFAYVALTRVLQTMYEARQCGLTLKAWWNDTRMWAYKRTTSYLFAAVDTFLKLAGLQASAFVITAKVADEDVTRRFADEVMEFGADSPMLDILCALALLNLLCLAGGVARVVAGGAAAAGELWAQLVLCGAIVALNAPLFEGLLRKDSGRVPLPVARKGGAMALGLCVVWIAMVKW